MSIRTRLLLIALLATAFPALLVLARFLQERDAAVADDTARLSAMAHSRAVALDEKIQGTAQLLYGLARVRDADARQADQAEEAAEQQLGAQVRAHLAVQQRAGTGRIVAERRRIGLSGGHQPRPFEQGWRF